MNEHSVIRVISAREHNLRGVTVEIPRGRITVITGPSGSGKSSLAFDTIFAEGRRRYVESLSVQVRQFLEQLPKPNVERIDGLTPTIAVEQRVGGAGPRSTVATSTEIHDFLRVLFARVGQVHCPKCGKPIVRQSIARMVDRVLASADGTRAMVLAPLVRDQPGDHRGTLEGIARDGFVRARLDGQVTLLEGAPPLDARSRHSIDVVVDRVTVQASARSRLAESMQTAARVARGVVVVTVERAPGEWVDESFSEAFVCPDHPDEPMGELTPQWFSFNSPKGACPTCQGLGLRIDFDPDLVLPNPRLPVGLRAVPAMRGLGATESRSFQRTLAALTKRFGIGTRQLISELPDDRRAILLHGDDARPADGERFEGIIPALRRIWDTARTDGVRRRLSAFLGEAHCPTCNGTRLHPAAAKVTVAGRSLPDVCRDTVASAIRWVDELRLDGEAGLVAAPLLVEIRSRLRFLADAGAAYLTLDRPSRTLSGGEWQRIRLATQLGSGLSGICYVLDEPTVGLHATDCERLVGVLRNLASMDNTVIVVEHDEQIIRAADYVIEIGPGAASAGGTVVATGSPKEIASHETSLTGRYLRGELLVSPAERRTPDWNHALELRGVTANNLKSIDVRIPIACFVAVTGVSGSGKSTLLSDVLLPALRRAQGIAGPRPGRYAALLGAEAVQAVVEVDQSPIGRSPRSNPASYTGIFDLLRQLFARTREARVRGYTAARFSFNVKGGRCEHCRGQGSRRVPLHLLPDAIAPCTDCGGSRYNRETLEVRFRGHSIADVLSMTVDGALETLERIPRIAHRLGVLRDVGLGYITLGQASSTLSGGEAQRVKLAAELQRESEGHTLYFLDEPTTGLHAADVHVLLDVLRRLVERGQTVICIEHQLDVIAQADWVIDLGPGGGDSGGRIVAEGPPEHIARCPESATGRFLRGRV